MKRKTSALQHASAKSASLARVRAAAAARALPTHLTSSQSPFAADLHVLVPQATPTLSTRTQHYSWSFSCVRALSQLLLLPLTRPLLPLRSRTSRSRLFEQRSQLLLPSLPITTTFTRPSVYPPPQHTHQQRDRHQITISIQAHHNAHIAHIASTITPLITIVQYNAVLDTQLSN